MGSEVWRIQLGFFVQFMLLNPPSHLSESRGFFAIVNGESEFSVHYCARISGGRTESQESRSCAEKSLMGLEFWVLFSGL